MAGPNFEEFHQRNPIVYQTLVRLARQAKARGRNKIGLRLLLEVCRWERFLATTGDDDYKINNNFAPLYARLIMRTEPDLAGIFDVRVLRSSQEGAREGAREGEIDWDRLLLDVE